MDVSETKAHECERRNVGDHLKACHDAALAQRDALLAALIDLNNFSPRCDEADDCGHAECRSVYRAEAAIAAATEAPR